VERSLVFNQAHYAKEWFGDLFQDRKPPCIIKLREQSPASVPLQNQTREIRPSGMRGRFAETWVLCRYGDSSRRYCDD